MCIYILLNTEYDGKHVILVKYLLIVNIHRIREPKKKKTPIEEKWEKYGSFGLTSVEQETHEKYFYGTEHWNYFTNDEDLGPVILSLKQENINGRDQFRYYVEGLQLS